LCILSRINVPNSRAIIMAGMTNVKLLVSVIPYIT
jgi:hypothetical protein